MRRLTLGYLTLSLLLPLLFKSNHHQVSQHPGNQQEDDLAQLQDAIRHASGGTLVVLDAQAGPLKRVWCLYEIWWVQRTPTEYIVQKRKGFNVTSPICSFDLVNDRYEVQQYLCPGLN